MLALTLCVANAWAGDGFEFTRETYDVLMKWVNFIILAVLIIKFASRPIANFLDDRKSEVATTISRLESQKQAAKEKLGEYQRQLTASRERRPANRFRRRGLSIAFELHLKVTGRAQSATDRCRRERQSNHAKCDTIENRTFVAGNPYPHYFGIG